MKRQFILWTSMIAIILLLLFSVGCKKKEEPPIDIVIEDEIPDELIDDSDEEQGFRSEAGKDDDGKQKPALSKSQTEEPAKQETSKGCTDTDGGNAPNVKGQACEIGKCGEDSCMLKYEDGTTSPTNSCMGEGCVVKEFSCSTSGMTSEYLECKNSCKDGACKTDVSDKVFIFKDFETDKDEYEIGEKPSFSVMIFDENENPFKYDSESTVKIRFHSPEGSVNNIPMTYNPDKSTFTLTTYALRDNSEKGYWQVQVVISIGDDEFISNEIGFEVL